MGKVKTVDFSESIAASDLKIGRCRQLFEVMMYVSIEGQCRFLTLVHCHLCMEITICFFQKPPCHFQPNFVYNF